MDLINYPSVRDYPQVSVWLSYRSKTVHLSLPAAYDQIDLAARVAVFANNQGIRSESVRVQIGVL